jgi:hypothetical protein
VQKKFIGQLARKTHDFVAATRPVFSNAATARRLNDYKCCNGHSWLLVVITTSYG